MKKALVYIFILTIISSYALGQSLSAIISDPAPQNDPLKWWLNRPMNFSSSVFGGVPAYIYDWSFCSSGCSPTTSTNPDELVTFNEVNNYTVTLAVEDSDIPSVISTDNFTVVVKMGLITSPRTDTGWKSNESIKFKAIGYTDNGPINYTWDFGDGMVDSRSANSGEEIEINHTYTVAGIYSITLNSSDGAGIKDQDKIWLLIVSVENVKFNCSLKDISEGCGINEIELLKLYNVNNSHAIGFDNPNMNYTKQICCFTTTLRPTVSDTNPGTGSTYAVLLNDSTSRSTGSHLMPEDHLLGVHYYLSSYVGVGSICERTTGNCSDLEGNKSCLYEYTYEGSPLAGAHFYNCTAESEPMITDGRMCCEIAEDCTNTIDDNSNTWTDTADNNFESSKLACPTETPCGISEQLNLPECKWMNSYCQGYLCDYRSLGVPQGYNNLLPPVGYRVSDFYNNSCWYVQDSSGVIHHDPLFGNTGCRLPPRYVYTEEFNSTQNNWSVDEFELINRCMRYHCSKGSDPDNNPLPAFVADMETNGYLTRHVCGYEQYWDPSFGPAGGCRDFSECYNPTNPLLHDCNYDFSTDFDTWLDDFNNTDTYDCFDETFGSSSEVMACCPVYKHGSNTYEYLDLEYYLVT